MCTAFLSGGINLSGNSPPVETPRFDFLFFFNASPSTESSVSAKGKAEIRINV
jgi:hypothetical protein